MPPHLWPWSHVPQHTIDTLRSERNIRSLAGLLKNRHMDVQWRAAEALGAVGPAATGTLVRSLDNPSVTVRLGALEALSSIGDPSSVEALIDTLNYDPDTEVRWAAAIALGQVEDPRGIGPLKNSLTHPDKYVRFGAAQSLKNLGYTAHSQEENATLAFALQDWTVLKWIGRSAIPLLVRALSDRDREVRNRSVEILGQMWDPDMKHVCNIALSDADSAVRWKAVLASGKCGIPMIDLPLYVSLRQKTRPNPYAAAILNLFFLGLGYNYLGKWWGFLVFMAYMTIIVSISLSVSIALPFFDLYPYIYSYPITAVFAYQTYRMARKIPDL